MRSGVAADSRDTYTLVAEVYDSVYAWKDYRREALRVHALVRRYGLPGARTLLDVGCGTGAHLEELRRWFDPTGLDSSPAMLSVARRRLGPIPLVEGKMESFRLGRQFDVITCLFSAIGYVRSKSALGRTLKNFARHLRVGGLALVEPWLTPEQYRVGGLHLAVSGTKRRPIARMNSDLRRGNVSVMDMHYVVGDRGRVRYWVERHEMGLFSRATMRAAFHDAGFDVRLLPSGFSTRRGLYVAVKRRSRETVAPRRGPTAGRRSRPSGP
ncbi:MAG TPA: class I SAM-dependent methyltransferase [Thermoplasmata archaeon]|nr:class I SAM-dependent methyltransferase [Thermoplasmata archaeon]